MGSQFRHKRKHQAHRHGRDYDDNDGDSDDDLISIGTGFDEAPSGSGPQRGSRRNRVGQSDPSLPVEDYKPLWQQEARNESGEQRFHGAFTGGFSAGYFNTAGSKEGWAPSQFHSSRALKKKVQAEQASIISPADSRKPTTDGKLPTPIPGQRVEDIMDKEDLADLHSKQSSLPKIRSQFGARKANKRKSKVSQAGKGQLSFDVDDDYENDGVDAGYFGDELEIVVPRSRGDGSLDRGIKNTIPTALSGGAADARTQAKSGFRFTRDMRGPGSAIVDTKGLVDAMVGRIASELDSGTDEPSAPLPIGVQLLAKIGWNRQISKPQAQSVMLSHSQPNLSNSEANLPNARPGHCRDTGAIASTSGPQLASSVSTNQEPTNSVPIAITAPPIQRGTFRTVIVDSDDEDGESRHQQVPPTQPVSTRPSVTLSQPVAPTSTPDRLTIVSSNTVEIPLGYAITHQRKYGRCHDGLPPLQGFTLIDERPSHGHRPDTIQRTSIPSDFIPGRYLERILTLRLPKDAPSKTTRRGKQSSQPQRSHSPSKRADDNCQISDSTSVLTYLSSKAQQRLTHYADLAAQRLASPVRSNKATLPPCHSTTQRLIQKARIESAARKRSDSTGPTSASPDTPQGHLSGFVRVQQDKSMVRQPGLYQPPTKWPAGLSESRGLSSTNPSLTSETSATKQVPLPPKLLITQTRGDPWFKAAIDAAAMKFYGPLTRRVTAFYPHPLLSRRLNLPPLTTSTDSSKSRPPTQSSTWRNKWDWPGEQPAHPKVEQPSASRDKSEQPPNDSADDGLILPSEVSLEPKPPMSLFKSIFEDV
ncbi:hypothetical protein BJ085DRAFT_34645 [Dimargaris cristalligena]|uniref:G patch domain-containing protein n=1 Tax=Dimargaris cristalligena TaxID=215637 RepID=A0A4P9ZNQ5_9FUNG|nr:hypothetical protein BJ085DRAFT_34645 [Dimargaris cristalligena]|eukprot:RKP35054.1 hypothetical protein BJ085DRAFT_34645 [Dimargaris cristalligena]